ncbi:MAG: Mrp/NBP35 family ATP-binding protein [Pirellulaceae bacterium]|nr:Mrp/NBP35 family ATP-binding protein [Pirellulaceae bacterium]
MSNTPVDIKTVEQAISDFKDPETGRSALRFEQIRDIAISPDGLSMTLALTSWAAPIANDIKGSLEECLRSKFPALANISVSLATHDRPAEQLGEIGLTAKSVIAVGSGKGGVGKSTIAACLAFGLRRQGCKVGLMDADVYGPSVPHLLGVSGRPAATDNKIEPIDANGMPVMSMGFLVPPDEAVVWRGPMLHGAITQFLRDTRWGDLDYLIIDMPPGTGDIALTLSQLIPLTGAVVVCTPQDVALLDAVKAIAMFGKVNIPILGVVENMSGFVCPDCEKRHDIFGSGGARSKAEELQVPFLGEVPINIQIRSEGDQGTLETVFDNPTLAPYLEQVAYSVVRDLARKAAATPPTPSLPVLG